MIHVSAFFKLHPHQILMHGDCHNRCLTETATTD
jgi:hypothetical protein